MARNREMCAYFSINTSTFTAYNEKLNFKEPKAPMCHQYSLRHRRCGVRDFIHELFVSKTRTSEVRASEGF